MLRFGENVATYDFENHRLDEMPLEPEEDGTVRIRWLVDRPLDDLFGGGGACVAIRRRADPGRANGTNTRDAEWGMATIESLTID